MQAVCSSLATTPVACASAAKAAQAPVQAKAAVATRVAVAPKAAFSNAAVTKQMLVWEPENNKYFETLSFLPPLTDDQISKQVDYIVNNGWTPCLEFADAEHAYVKNVNNVRFGPVSAGYYDNRYWTMYKLPMFGCTDPSQVLTEIANAANSFPEAFIRICGFDSVRQVQCASFLVRRPPSAKDYREPSQRSV
jgi:ribulose-bisphosphate carboxylase small chain